MDLRRSGWADTQGVGHDWVDFFVGPVAQQQQRQTSINNTQRNTGQKGHKKFWAVPINKKDLVPVILAPVSFPFACANQQSEADPGTAPPILTRPLVNKLSICQGSCRYIAIVPTGLIGKKRLLQQ